MTDTHASLLAQAATLAAEFPGGADREPMAVRAGPTAEILIEGVVGLDVTLGGFRTALRTISDDAPLVLRVNSPGGSVFDGFGIFNLLAQRKGPVTARIDGQAASAASYIVMAASRVEMPAASLLMIHNASSITWGTKEDHQASIGILSKIDALMARIYAARTGRTTEDVEALMEAETWFTGEEAVAAGFADALIDSPVAAATALSIDARRMIAGFKSLPAKIAAMATTAAPPVAAPPTTEVQMDVQNTPGGVAALAPTPIAASAIELAQVARRANLGPDWIETQALAGATLHVAQGNALDAMAAAAAAAVTPSTVTAPRIEITNNERATMRARMQSAIVCSIRGQATQDTPAEAREFLNVGLIGMMRETLALAGDKTAHRLDNAALWERVATATGGSHTVSDFPLVLRDATNVALQMDFGEFPKTFEAWASSTDVNDFKAINSAQIGQMPTLTRVAEGQPVPYRPIAEEGESYKVDTYAGIVALTREMIINDRLNAFGRVIRTAAGAAERALSDLVYFQITDNANMADGNRLFSAAHLNVGAGSTGTDFHYLFASDRPTVEVAYLGGRRAPEITEEEQFNVLGVAYRVIFDFGAKAISWRGVTRERALVNVDGTTVAPLEQLLLTQREVGGSLISVPRNLVLLVPPAQHFPARRLVTAVTPTQASNVNIYGGLQLVVEPRLGNTTVV